MSIYQHKIIGSLLGPMTYLAIGSWSNNVWVLSCGVCLKSNQKVVGYSCDGCAITAPVDMSQQVSHPYSTQSF